MDLLLNKDILFMIKAWITFIYGKQESTRISHAIPDNEKTE
jgi:hypothetical protein